MYPNSPSQRTTRRTAARRTPACGRQHRASFSNGSKKFCSRKGEIIISHTLALGLTILLVISLVVVFNNFRTQQSAELADVQLRSICYRIKSTAEAMWRPINYSTSAVMGRIVLNLPLRVAGVSYSATMFNKTISMIAPDAAASTQCYLGIGNVSGATAGGIAELIWTREGTFDKIELR